MNALTQPVGATSPFKFLDAYGAQDAAVFFGRDDEVETLYRLLGESRLVLVYGQSGTGKTSLVQCGLTEKFSSTNWLPLTVRRGDDLGVSLGKALAGAALTPLAPGTGTVAAIRSVFLDHLRPVFLIFDQFEELYVLGSSEEQQQFYTAVNEVLMSDVSCRIIISLREEYLAALDRFEQLVPSLFDKRLRVETMTNRNVEAVILGTTQAYSILLEHGADTAERIIDQLDDKRIGVQLAYLQVYLDHLYRAAVKDSLAATITFTDAAIDAAGKLGDVMAGFLEDQQRAIQIALKVQGLGVPPGGVARLLEEFVSAEGTKQPGTYDQVLARIPSAQLWLQAALELLQNDRLLRQVDGHYELAQNALAGRIAERRSGEQKQLLVVERRVRSRLAEFAQTKIWLNSGELGQVALALKQVDPLDGSPRLKLDPAMSGFVAKSRRRMWGLRILLIGALLLTVTIPLQLLAKLTAQSQLTAQERAKLTAQSQLTAQERANIFNRIDVQAFDEFRSGFPVFPAGQHKVIVDLHGRVQIPALQEGPFPTPNEASLKFLAMRDVPKGASDVEMEASFWPRLSKIDNIAGPDTPTALEKYATLAKEMRKQYLADKSNLLIWIKYKAVLWHAFLIEPQSRVQFADGPIKSEFADELFEVMNREMVEFKGDPLGFEYDLKRFCNPEESYYRYPVKGCEKYQIVSSKNEVWPTGESN